MSDRGSRLHRHPLLAPLVPQARDLTLLRDLFYLRWATTPALALTASWVNGGAGQAYFPKRLAQLWRAGYVERFHAGYSRYLHGSRHFLYTIGNGKASAAARTGQHPSAIPSERWRQVLAEATPARERTRDALLAAGLASTEIDRVLHNNTELAMKYYAGESSGVRHHALCADLVAALWFSARSLGWPVEDIQPDGVADLSFRDPEPHRHLELFSVDGVVPIKPDFSFAVAGYPFVIEAETGTTSSAKLRLKLQRYTRRFEITGERRMRVILHCATDAHAERSLAVVAAIVPDALKPQILVSRASIIATLSLARDEAVHALTAAKFQHATSHGEDAAALFTTDEPGSFIDS